jgi:hypothetical protein
MADTHKEIPFSGKMMTGEPATIGMNFRTLKNMRYTDTHIKGVLGMTKINSSDLASNPKIRSAFHFKKSQPVESHLMLQAYNSAGASPKVFHHQTAIPNAGNFTGTALWTDNAAAGRGYFANAPDGQMFYANGVDTCIYGGNEIRTGAFIACASVLVTAEAVGTPRDFTDAINNTKTDSGNVATIAFGTYPAFLVGSPRPIQGIKLYISTANGTASTMTCSAWSGSAWVNAAITDNTDTGPTLAVTGTVTFGSSIGAVQPRYIEGYFLYWYQFSISGGSANISQCTLIDEFQNVLDMWDGVFRDVTRFYKYDTTYIDYTTNVLNDDYDSTSAGTFANLNSLPAYDVGVDHFIEIGFGEKITGLKIDIPSPNTNATVMTVYYWDGAAYATVGAVCDGTSAAGKSFAQTGVVSWSNANLVYENKKAVRSSPPLYYYLIGFSNALDDGVHVNYVGGITAQKQINYFKFPVFAQGRMLLCCDMSGDKNKAVCSSKYLPQVYNGDDSVDIYFGEEGELTCGTELFSQFGSSLYSLILMFKDHETWVMAGQDIAQWADNTFLLSSTIGCPAPLTLKTINLQAEPGAGVNRALAIWLANTGVFMSDGRAPIPVHGDIKAYFDREDARCIKSSLIGESIGFVDVEKSEYHLLVASGTAATGLNTELVYDIARNKWFEIDRGTDLACGVTVHDTDGNPYAYGFIDTGYIERLEYGATFDGTAISHTIQFGDMPLAGLATETRLSDVRLITVAKASGDVTLTHYSDSSSTGTVRTMSPARTGYRIAQPYFVNKLDADPFHAFKLETTVSFEPIALVATFHPTHEDN